MLFSTDYTITDMEQLNAYEKAKREMRDKIIKYFQKNICIGTENSNREYSATIVN